MIETVVPCGRPARSGAAATIFLAMSTHPGPARTRRLSALTRRRATWVAGAIVALSVVFFLLASGAGLSDPGLQYDELLFVNGALGGTHAYHGFIASEALGVPTMLMTYIGALKAWLYAPIFSVFGVSVDTIRVPAVLLAALAIVLAVALVRRLLGTWPTLAFAVLLGTDPVLSSMSRADWGPIVLSALLRVCALLAYFAFLRRRQARYLWLLVISLSLGVFNKLDYGWFIVGLLVAALVMHRRELWRIVRSRPVAMFPPLAFQVVVAIVVFFEIALPAERLPRPGHLSIGARITEVENLFRGTFDGAAVYQYMTGSLLAHATLMGSLFPWVLLGSCGVAGWFVVWGRRRAQDDPLRARASTTAFLVVLFIVMALGITATRQATGPHNIFLLWPLPSLLAICLFATALALPWRSTRLAAATVLGIAVLALLATQVRTSLEYVHAYRDRREWTAPWSPEIYAAASAVSHSATGVTSIITADWGLGTQIFALGNEAVRDRFNDVWPSFTSATAMPAALQRQWFQGSMIVVFHTSLGQVMPGTTARVEAVLRSLGGRAHVLYKGRQIEADIVSAPGSG
jgi:4-amino-4-deoxy-L-arabinose transferase-like glycosyltransferase